MVLKFRVQDQSFDEEMQIWRPPEEKSIQKQNIISTTVQMNVAWMFLIDFKTWLVFAKRIQSRRYYRFKNKRTQT